MKDDLHTTVNFIRLFKSTICKMTGFTFFLSAFVLFALMQGENYRFRANFSLEQNMRNVFEMMQQAHVPKSFLVQGLLEGLLQTKRERDLSFKSVIPGCFLLFPL